MSVSLVLNNEVVAALAKRVVEARKLYGADSAYVIGIVAGFEDLVGNVEGGEDVKRLLRDRIVELESNGDSSVPAPVEKPIESGESLSENTWIKGLVKWFNNDKGYGFISTEANIDVFVHWRDISSWDRSIGQGEEVEFMVTKTAKGFQAVNIMKATAKDTDTPQEEAPINQEAATSQEGGPRGVIRPGAGGSY